MRKSDYICVLGSNGFVGRNLVKRLKQDGYENIYTFNRDNIDLLNQYKTNGVLAYGFDYVFMCSAIVGGIQANINEPYKFLHENLVMQNNIINACIKNKVKKVVFLGSSCIYPKDYKDFLKEEDLMQAPLEPTNRNYALAKIVGLYMCESANNEFDTHFISLMPCNIYGEGDHFDLEKSHVMSALIKKIYNAKTNKQNVVEVWGSGKPKREFLYIDDLIDSMIWSIDNIKKTDTFFNVGTGSDISIEDLAYMIKGEMGYTGKFKFNTEMPDGMYRKCLDVSKIHNRGWKHSIDLKEGIKKTVEWYIKQIENGVEL